MGHSSPVSGVEEVTRLITDGWEEKVGGRLEFINDPDEIVRRSLEHIDKKRAALGLPEYEPDKWGQSGDWRIQEFIELPFAEKIEAAYGNSAK
jgi:hypothetical protein